MLDLNACVDPRAGWHLAEAWQINDSGQIAGFGVHDGAVEACLLEIDD
jgi:hypothetical protein